MKSGNLNFLEPSGPLQVCNGTALPHIDKLSVRKVHYQTIHLQIVRVKWNCTGARGLSTSYSLGTRGKLWPGIAPSVLATRYGVDGPGIEFRCGRDFPHSSRTALGSTQPPIQWVLCFPRVYSRQSVALTIHPI